MYLTSHFVILHFLQYAVYNDHVDMFTTIKCFHFLGTNIQTIYQISLAAYYLLLAASCLGLKLIKHIKYLSNRRKKPLFSGIMPKQKAMK
jgi:hypothetical protein